MDIVCLADNSHEMSSLIFAEKYRNKNRDGICSVVISILRVKISPQLTLGHIKGKRLPLSMQNVQMLR